VQADSTLQDAIAAFRQGDLERARKLAEHSVQSGSSPQADHLLGLIRCRRGEIEAGIEHLRRAAEAEPDNVAFRVMLVRALIDSAQPADALVVAAPPDGTSPTELALWRARAEAARGAGEGGAETEAWQAICSARPDDFEAWTNLGRTLLAQQRFGDAETAYRRALAISPTFGPALHELGLVLERTNQIAQLCHLLDRAAAAGVRKDQLAELWALRELRAGRPEEAQKLLGTPSWEYDPVRWSRLRARAADATGDAAEAFDAATTMNRAVQDFQGWRRRAAGYRDELRALAATITPEWAVRLPQATAEEQVKLAFLVGFPRSGTTLVDTFLMGHPACTVIEEHPLLFDAGGRIGPIGLLDRADKTAVDRARDDYLEALGGLLDPATRGIAIDKFPLNIVAGPLLHVLFEAAPIIFVQRHPCDAVLSGFMQSFVANLGMASFLDIGDAADFYDCAMGVWTASRSALPLNVHTTRYEELIRKPESVLRPMVEFIGLEWDDRLLDHRGTAKKRGMIDNTSYNQVTEPLSTAASGRWKRYEKQLEPVLHVLLPWAERLGYAL
jgi:tetratricopeptide (TPR) repeat protein